MQAASDIMLGWIRTVGLDGVERDFYIRQLWDAKGSADIETMTQSGLTWYANACGSTLARAHARSGDTVAIGAYLGGSAAFDRALTSFAEAYADQNERDYSALQEAVATGRVTAETGL
jgi:thiamine monophosphate kinase